MFLSNLFVEEKRERRRLQKGRSKFMDIFWYSEVKHYRNFRFCYNFPIGFGICLIVYLLAWKRLNFLEFNAVASEVFKWMMVACFAMAFSLNAVFRCALLCVCVGALSKTGQGFLTIFIVNQLSEGPIQNIVENFRLTSSIVLCHLDMQSRITAQRITLASGPIEALLEKHFGQSATIGRKVVRTLKSLIEPFTEDLSTSNEEDETLAAVIDNAQAMADRQQIVEGMKYDEGTSSTPTIEEVQPVWTKFKSKLGRSIARRFTQRCQQMFAGAVEKCHKKFQDAQSLCYESTPFFIAFFTCRHMNSLNLCQPSKMTSAANKYCALGQKLDENNPLTPDLDDQMDSMENISKQIKDQLKLNIHFKAVEEPENEWIRALNEIEVTVQNHVDWFKMALGVFKDILSGFLVFIVYWVFRGNVNAITTQGTRHGNTGATAKEEIIVNGLMSPFGWPTCEELRATWVSFLRWSVIFLVALVVVVVDYYYYRVLVHQRRAYTRNHCRRRGTYCRNDQDIVQFLILQNTGRADKCGVPFGNRCHLIGTTSMCGYLCHLRLCSLAGSKVRSGRSSLQPIAG
uniref:Dendritic cell-specific transmembrane protein-like domain-containing protein n=1 Tax=Ditylenchus dipsaci TaxID=166011 RepID=A0A915DY80_9BILA